MCRKRYWITFVLKCSENIELCSHVIDQLLSVSVWRIVEKTDWLTAAVIKYEFWVLVQCAEKDQELAGAPRYTSPHASRTLIYNVHLTVHKRSCPKSIERPFRRVRHASIRPLCSYRLASRRTRTGLYIVGEPNTNTRNLVYVRYTVYA